MTSEALSFAPGQRALRAPSRRQAVAGVTAFVAIWAVVEAVATLVFRRVTPWQVVFGRYTVHLAIVLVLWGRQAPWRTRQPGRQLVRSAMMLVMPGAFVVGIDRGISASWIITISWCAPLLVLFFASLLEHERAAAGTWAAAALGWITAWIYFAPEGRPPLSAIVFGLAMAGSFAAYVPMTRGLRHESLATNLFYTAVVPWAALLPVMSRVWVAPTPIDVAALVFVGSAGWVTLLALDRAAEAGPVSDTAPLLHLQVAFTMLIAIAEGHHPGLSRIAAASVLVASTLALASLGLRSQRTVELA